MLRYALIVLALALVACTKPTRSQSAGCDLLVIEDLLPAVPGDPCSEGDFGHRRREGSDGGVGQCRVEPIRRVLPVRQAAKPMTTGRAQGRQRLVSGIGQIEDRKSVV